MSSSQAADNFDRRLAEKRQVVNDTFASFLSGQTNIHPDLEKAIRYTLEAPGKRIRGALVLFACEVIAGSANHNAQIAAAAVEMVHTYSLVHDDLPAMDDDDLRRGLPTCHKAFDEATAILTGDALLTLAFEILSGQIDNPATAAQLINRLAAAAGPAGMIAGQIADLKAENSTGSTEILEYIHTNKTAKMFAAAVAMGAIAADANQNQINALSEYGLKIGMAFQIADDILDVCSSNDQLGKTAGKDQKAGKLTYPALIGIEESEKIKGLLTEQAIAALKPFAEKADTLRQLAYALLQREK